MTRYAEPTSALYLIEAPDPDDVVSVEDMKKHCEVEADNTDDDDKIEAYRDAAIAHFDGPNGILQRAIAEQTWELRLSCFPCDGIDIPLPPLIEVVSVKYIDEDGEEQPYDAAKYHVTGEGGRGRIALRSNQSWPTVGLGWPEPVIVRFRAGSIDSSVSPAVPNVPTPIVQAVKLLTEHWYENRSNVVIGDNAVVLPWAVEALLQPLRVF